MKWKPVRTTTLHIQGIKLYIAVNSFVSKPVITGCRLFQKEGKWTIAVKLTGAKKRRF